MAPFGTGGEFVGSSNQSTGGGGGGSGTVTSVAVATANGFAGTVASPTTAAVITLKTTITGILKGNGTAISAATPGTDYLTVLTGDVTTSGNAATLVATSNVITVVSGIALPLTGGTLSGALNMGNNKITNLANGTNPGDAVNFSQLPTALPPNGAAGGDLSGTYPNPTVAKVQGVAITATEATLLSQLNGATTRSASATVVAGEQTVLTGSTASQTITLPPSTAASSSPNLIINNSTQVWTIAAGAGTTQNRLGATAACNLIPGSFIEYILIGTVWYMVRYSLAPPQSFTASGAATWIPSGTGGAIFQAYLIGGGAGGANGSGTNGGNGGGGGEVRLHWDLGNVTANQTVTVGAGGAAASNGVNTTIGALVTAIGGFTAAGQGGDGQIGPATAAQVASGGAGGIQGAAGNAGGQGGPGTNRVGSGGGGGGGTNAAGGAGGGGSRSGGGAGVTNAGGGGGSAGGATGGAGSGTTGGNGSTAAANSGSGGGGGGGASVAPGNGGAGGSGMVVITQVG